MKLCFVLIIILVLMGFVSADVSYELDWDKDDIVNGEEFEITFEVFSLEEEEYDAKLWIEYDGKTISERYDPNEDKWKSGFFYVNSLFQGPGDETGKMKIRIGEDYSDFSGNANAYFRLRDHDKIEDEIVVLEGHEDSKSEEEDDSDNIEDEDFSNDEIDEIDKINEGSEFTEVQTIEQSNLFEIIELGNKIDIVETENIKSIDNIVYESKIARVTKYSIYGFALLCVVLCILIIWRKL